jgi:hypothetical protein
MTACGAKHGSRSIEIAAVEGFTKTAHGGLISFGGH